MTRRPLKNLAASVRTRLRNRSLESGEDLQVWLHRYAAERFLYRLGESVHRDRFILKGAMLFPLWGGSLYRPTRDLDLTAYGSSQTDELLAAFREICRLGVPDDGLVFDADSLRPEPIRDDTEYGGVRIRFKATLGGTQIALQVDIGFGNAIVPPARETRYPTLLDSPAPSIRAYPQEAVVAEKFHAMVFLGERNTRMKDFYDLHTLAAQFPFDGDRLSRAIAATFEQRRTAIDPALPAPLAPRFYADDTRAVQWRAYLDRNRLPGAPADFTLLGERIQAFLGPVWHSLAAGRPFLEAWPASGPWPPGGTP